MVGSFEIAGDLLAKEAIGEGMFAVAAQLNGTAVFDRHDHGAGVGAIVGADLANDRSIGMIHWRSLYWAERARGQK